MSSQWDKIKTRQSLTDENINESNSSDRLLQVTHSPSSHSDKGIGSTMDSNNDTSGSKNNSSTSAQDRSHEGSGAPKSLDLDANHRQPKNNSLKNWVRLASFEKSDLSPSDKSVRSNNNSNSDYSVTVENADPNSPDTQSAVGDEGIIHDDKSGTSDGTLDSPSKRSLLWGKAKGKNKLSLPGLQNEGASVGGSTRQGSEATPGNRFLSAAMAVHASVRLSRLERAKRKAKWAGKKLLVFMLSHIGLILVMLMYATAGGFLFRWLERDHSLQSKGGAVAPVAQERVAQRTERDVTQLKEIDLKEIRNKYIEMMWNETLIFNLLHPVTWSNSMNVIMKEYEGKLYEIILASLANATETGSGTSSASSSLQQTGTDVVEDEWTIPASLLFSTTVITSIGYGDITPKTTAGKLVCIPFAIVGIPLTLLCLANIGQLMAGCCRFAWRRISQCGRLCRHDKDKDSSKDKDHNGKTRVPISVSLCILLGYNLLGALIFSSWEKDWTFLDGFYFSFITLSTIGFGDFVPGQYEKSSNERRVVCVLYLLVGLAMLSMVFQLMIDSVMEVVESCARFLGLSQEQLKEEIQEIDETPTPVPNLATQPATARTSSVKQKSSPGHLGIF